MENASKALIIAGAILISIVLIAVGVMVVNGANGAIDTAVGSMSDHEKTIFNQKFEPYAGENVKGSSVKSLISAIIASNATVTESGSGLKVKVKTTEGKFKGSDGTVFADGTDEDDALSKIKAKVQNSGTYTVKLGYTGGVVSSAEIK